MTNSCNIKCCINTNGETCHNPAAFRVGRDIGDNNFVCTYCCKEHLQETRRMFAPGAIATSLRLLDGEQQSPASSPQCHVVGCQNRVTHSHYSKDDPYGLQYFCTLHTVEHMLPDKTYIVEPWKTELSEEAIAKLTDFS